MNIYAFFVIGLQIVLDLRAAEAALFGIKKKMLKKQIKKKPTKEPQLCCKEWLHLLKVMICIQKMTQQYFPQAHLFRPV